MKQFLLATLFAFMCIPAAKAQTRGVVSGNVVDAVEHRGMPGAILRLSCDNRYTVSDRNGHYEFLNVPAGEYAIEVEYMGYNTYSGPVTVLAGDNTVLDITLQEAAYAVDEVVVMGDQSRSQAKALNTQRTNERVTNVISSDQMGRFPDSNIGEALKRVPGIAMQGDQGEARNIVIRGLAPGLNSVTLNGNRVPSAEGDNRNVQLDLFPSDMIQTVEVSKTLTPDMDADAIGGSVNLITRSAPIKRRISATILGGYNQIRNKATYGGSLVYADRFFKNRWGVVLNASYLNKNYGSDNVEGVWAKDDNGDVYMSEMDIRKYTVQRIRRSFGLNTDWKINASNTLTFDAMFNWRDDLENRYRLNYEAEPEYDANGKVTGYVGTVKRENKGGIGRGRRPGRLEVQQMQSYAFSGRHLISPKFDLTWNVNFARSVERKRGERYIAYVQEDVKIDQDLSTPGKPFLSSPEADLSKFDLDKLTENNDFTMEDEIGGRIDARVPLSVVKGQKGRLRFGVRARFKDKERNNRFTKYKPVGDFPGLLDQGVEHNNPLSMDKKYVPGTFFDPKALATLDLDNTSLFKAKDAPDKYMADNYKANERILAAYVRWDQNFTEKIMMTVGVRAEHTYTKYEGARIVNENFDAASRQSYGNAYVNFLPSISFKYDVRKDLVLRAAFTTALARPSYYDLVPFAGINSEERSIAAGNSDLKPTYSYNVDVMGEYYFKSVGIFSVGGFYKNLRNFIYDYADNSYNSEKFGQDFPDIANPVPAGENWHMVRPMNGRSVTLYGFEVAFQRKLDFINVPFIRNFGIYVNYTFTKSVTKGVFNEDGEERKGLQLPGTAPHMVNTSLSWENEYFSARVSLNYSGRYLDEVGGDEFTDRYYDDQIFLDANASCRVTKWMRIFVEANNLLNTPLRYYQGGVRSRVAQMEYYKPTYTLGLKFEF